LFFKGVSGVSRGASAKLSGLDAILVQCSEGWRDEFESGVAFQVQEKNGTWNELYDIYSSVTVQWNSVRLAHIGIGTLEET
jgi:hypothetical protein